MATSGSTADVPSQEVRRASCIVKETAESAGTPPASPTLDATPPPLVPFRLPILLQARAMQQQNGLRHNDYNRYRRYCSRKLWRIRKALKFKQGKNRYVGKPLPSVIEDERFLVMILVSAERCWSYGVQLKADNASASTVNTRVRYHCIRKFGKATRYARLLEELCSKYADRKSQLEAKAYCLWLGSVWAMEKERWKAALADLTQAQDVYQQLKTVSAGGGDESKVEEEAAFKAKLEELQPSIRLCQYHLRRMGIDWEDIPTAFAAHPKASKDDGKQFAETAGSAITWRGRDSCPPSEAVRESLRKCTELWSSRRVDLKKLEEGRMEEFYSELSAAEVIERYGDVVEAYQEALDAIHSEMLNIPSGGADSSWAHSEGYTLEAANCLSVERSLLLQSLVFWQWASKRDQTSSVVGGLRPEEGVRYADMLKQAIGSMKEGRQVPQSLAATLSACLSVVDNSRALCLASYFCSEGKLARAYVLADLVNTRNREDIRTTGKEDEHIQRLVLLFTNLKELVWQNAERLRCFCIAEIVSTDKPAAFADDGGVSFIRQEETDPIQEILQREIVVNGETFPPKPEGIACKPLLFDLAFSTYQTCIEETVGQPLEAAKKAGGIMGRLSSWWGRK